MELSLLADNPSAIQTVATWYFDEWCRETDRYTKDEVIEKVSSSINRNKAPLLVIAKELDELMGAAELKIREMEIYPEYEFWLGGVFVPKSARGNGIASLLVEEVISQARKININKLYLQTEDLSGGLYLKHGFKPLEKTSYKGVNVLVMVAEIGV